MIGSSPFFQRITTPIKACPVCLWCEVKDAPSDDVLSREGWDDSSTKDCGGETRGGVCRARVAAALYVGVLISL